MLRKTTHLEQVRIYNRHLSSALLLTTTVLYVGLLNFNLLVLEDPYLEHVWATKAGDAEKRHGIFHSLSGRGKVRWCFDNAFSTRGIGWNWGMRKAQLSPAPPPGTSKPAFLRACSYRILLQYLVHDIASAVLLWLTHGGREALCELSLLRRSLGTACWAASSSAAMDIGYHVACMVGVATGLFWTRTEDAHPAIGAWTESYTLARFWGRTWHQNFRRALQTPSRYVARELAGAPQGSSISRYIQWYVAFTLSGLYHYAAAKMVVPTESFANTLGFFALMPNLLLLEDWVISFAEQRTGWGGPRWRLLGLAWTFVIMTTTAAGFVDDLVYHGLVTAQAIFPFSPSSKALSMVPSIGF